MSTPTPPRFVILAAVDGSPASANVATTAARLAATHPGAELHLLHVIDSSAEADSALLDESEGDRAARHHKVLEAAIEPVVALGLPRPIEHLVAGTPKAVVLEVAAVLSSDLIVVGTHGRTGLHRLLVGSVAELIVRSAHCHVLVVREKSYPTAD